MKGIILIIAINIIYLANVSAQNYCSQAELLTINAQATCNFQPITMGADLDNQDDISGQVDITMTTGCATPVGSWNAYWGTFTGNGNMVDIVITNPDNDGFVVVFENTPCGGVMTELTCFNFLDIVGGGLSVNTLGGATYTIAIFRSNGSSSMNAELSIIDNPSALPYNLLCDQCGVYGQTPVLNVDTLNTDCFVNSNSVITDDSTPMPPVPGCTSGSNWYLASFTATSDLTNAYIWGKEEDMLSVSILEGPCYAMTEVACANSTDEDLPTFLQANTVPGQEYFVLITTSSGMSAGNLCIYEDPPIEPTMPVCNGGMSFEDGVGSGWDASHGSYHATDVSLTGWIWDDVVPGIPSPVKGEITSGAGYDPNVGGMLSVVAPGGGNNSFRLGSMGTAEGFGPVTIPGYSSAIDHAACEVMSFCFTVDANNVGFGYKYAIVMDYSSHAADLQPKMEVFIEEDCGNGNYVGCGQYEHYPNDGNSAFHFVGDNTDVAGQNDGLIFTYWTDVATDLSNYIGQDVRVTFRIRDCEGGGGINEPGSGSHWAYAYIDTYCTPLDIVTPEFCAGTSSIQICGPDGFASYNWPAGQPGVVGPLNNQCITINNPVAGDTYTVNMISISGCPVTKIITLAEVPAILPADTTFICVGDAVSLDVIPTGTNGPYSFNWSTGDTGSTINVSPGSTTTYSVTITNVLGCSSTYDFVVAVDPCNAVDVTLPDPTICENDCTDITASTSGTTGPVSYVWTPNIGNGPGPYSVCPTITTEYILTITDQLGFSSTDTATVIVDPIYNITENINACENTSVTYPDGTTATITSSTSYTSNLTTTAGCDSIIVTNVTMDPIYNITQNINACENSSVTYPDGTNATITASTSYTSNLSSTAGCDSIIVTNVIMDPIYASTDNITVCTGANYTYPDGTTSTNITVNESHVSNLTSAAGCDSVITTNITVNTAFATNENFNICSGTNYTYPDGTSNTNIITNESHVSNFISVLGCDSIVTTNLTVDPVYNLTENINACENSSVTYPDGTSATITASTSYTSNLTTTAGCDSIIVTNVTMDLIYNLTENINACENSTVTYPDGLTATITASTSYTSNLTTIAGCDSIIVTAVTMDPIFASTENMDICTGTNYSYPDGTSSTNITVNESHVSNLTSVAGCDSIITTNLNIIVAFTITENFNICSGTNYTYPDGTSNTNIITNESHVSNFISVLGCDSIVTTNLTVDPIYNITENINACENTSVTYPDGTSATITASTSYTSNLTTTAGCDSIIVTNVTMDPIYNITQNINACENSTVTYPDGTNATITASTSYTSNLTTSAGCDSIVVTNVTMDPIYALTENVTVCSGANYTYPDGTTSTNILVDQTHLSNFTTTAGCDSIITTILTVNQGPTVVAGPDQTVCEGESITLTATGAQTYLWNNGISNGVPFTPSQPTMIYLVTGTDANGCTGTDQVNVTVNQAPQVQFSADRLSGCIPHMVTFTNLTSPSGVNCEWTFGDGNTGIGCDSVTHTYTIAGVYNVGLTVTSLQGCTGNAYYTEYITVSDPPIASISADAYVLDLDDTEVQFYNNSTGGDSYEWTFGDGMTSFEEEPSHTYPEVGNASYDVSMVVSNQLGCEDMATLTITVNDILIFYIPNVFTPNGDHFNNTFQPVFTSGYDPYDFHLMIFDRWGEIIFESYDATKGWDGTYGEGGIVQDGVYVWKIDFKETMSDKRHELSGHVTVLK